MGFEPVFGRPASDGAKYDLLRSLCDGQLGPLALGRASGQSDASRFVTLRLLAANDLARVEVAVRRAARIAHARLLKVLGLAWIDEMPYLASEYVEGLPVGNLSRVLAATETSVIQEVALRIALDTLQSITEARAELRRAGVHELPRCLYPDTAWVASFGETLLSDVGVADELAGHVEPSAHDRAWAAPEGSRASSARADVFATGALLFELLTGRDLSSVRSESNAPIPELSELPRRGSPIAAPLVELVSRALALDPSQRFLDPEHMADAIRALPEHWLGSEAQVRATIEPLALRAADLKASEPSLDLTSGEHPLDLWEIPTRSLRLRVANPEDDRQTVRPESPEHG